MSERFKDGLCQCLLGILPILCFLGFVRGGLIANDDSQELFIPVLEHFRRSLHQGIVPLWNPFLLVGQTMAGFQNSPIYYPPNYLVYWLRPERLLVWTCILHTSWGALGHWRLARNWGMSRPAAFCVGVLLGFSASVYCDFERFPALQIASWTPWFVLALDRHFAGSRPALGYAGLILGLQLLCAYPQIVHLQALLVAVLAGFVWIPRAGWRAVLFGLVQVGLVGLLIGAPYLICVSDYMANNIRSLATPGYFQVYPLSPRELLYNCVFTTLEPYNIPLLASLLALGSLGYKRAPAGLKRACWVLIGLGFALALANATRFEGLVSWIPLYQSLRYRNRYICLSQWAIGWLAGLTVDRILARQSPGRRLPVGVLLGLATILATVPNAAAKHVCYQPETLHTNTAYRLLPAGQEFYRILVLPGLRNQYWNWGVFHGISNVGGYNGAADLSVQKLLHQAEFRTELNAETARTTLDRNMIRLRVALDAPILRNFCLRYSLSSPNAHSAPELRESKYLPVAHAFLPAQVYAADERSALELMSRPEFDPQQECYLTAVPAALAGPEQPVACRYIEQDSDHCQVLVPAQPRARLLVLSEVYDPGWQAYADGRQLPVERVNVALRGVVVPAGVTRIDFRYMPRGIRWGLPLSALGLLLAFGLGRRRV